MRPGANCAYKYSGFGHVPLDCAEGGKEGSRTEQRRYRDVDVLCAAKRFKTGATRDVKQLGHAWLVREAAVASSDETAAMSRGVTRRRLGGSFCAVNESSMHKVP